MLELTTYTELELCHRLGGAYSGRCLDLHGHRYQVEITVAPKKGLNEDGMIVDFKKLKEVVKKALDDAWDHASCFRKDDAIGIAAQKAGSKRVHLIDANPTLEWMVAHWATVLQTACDVERLNSLRTRLTASEAARNTVTLTRDPGADLLIDPDGRSKLPDVADVADVAEPAPDAVPYLVSYKDALSTNSTVIYSAYKAGDLVEYCRNSVQKLHNVVGHTVILSISRLPV